MLIGSTFGLPCCPELPASVAPVPHSEPGPNEVLGTVSGGVSPGPEAGVYVLGPRGARYALWPDLHFRETSGWGECKVILAIDEASS